MIIVKTPFRISFAGGGSDLDAFYRHHYGAVVSTTISKYMYLMIHPYFHDKIRIKYSKTEDVNAVRQIQHPLVKECLKFINIKRGIEIASIADIPAGTGLGSSSAFCVGLLHALSLYGNKVRTKKWLAQKACQIEIDKVGAPIGKQDQYAVSFGSLNYLRFNPDGEVFVELLAVKPEIKKRLENNLLLFYVGGERRASSILTEQKSNMSSNKRFRIVCGMVKIAEEMRKNLLKGDLKAFSGCLHQGWILKRQVADSISNKYLDQLYKKACAAGASGGKLLGAGGSGFFLFYCEPKNQPRLKKTLGLRQLKFNFDNEGTKAVYMDQGER